MNFFEKIKKLLEENMTERAFKLWEGVNGMLPDCWEKSTSSTGKHHKKLDGRVPNQSEHVYEMLYSAVKLFRMFNIESKTSDADTLLFAVALHDSLKYGKWGDRAHTDYQHDMNAGDMINENRDTFLKLLDEEQVNMLEEAVRYHSGRWSTDVPNRDNFDFRSINPVTLFIHILDMMSTADLIQTDVREINDISINKTNS